MRKNYYVTTTLPYVNAAPHIGFALEIIQADVAARYHRILGEKIFFNTGTDEHGKKIYEMAKKAGMKPQHYADKYAAEFEILKKALNLSYDSFVRTTDENHKKTATAFWKRCRDNGYIKKKIYKAHYCVGCELEKTDSELERGRCPLHPNRKIEEIEEENYFFLFSKLERDLLKLYQENPDLVIPPNRMKEVVNFVRQGLNDFSISRVRTKMPWGIPVPDDPEQVMYVWFDALTNYISALGWPEKKDKFNRYWGTAQTPKAVQMAGKDNLRQQAAMWQAMLLAAKLPTSKQILIHGFITSGGQKMSKSLGNVINPLKYAKHYGAEALRYYLLAKVHPFEDSDFTREKFEASYQGELANGLGNLVARVAAMAEGLKFKIQKAETEIDEKVKKALEGYRFERAMEIIWERIRVTDQFISNHRVWEKRGEERQKALEYLVEEIRQIAGDLRPLMPETAEKITRQFGKEKIVKGEPLFPRLD